MQSAINYQRLNQSRPSKGTIGRLNETLALQNGPACAPPPPASAPSRPPPPRPPHPHAAGDPPGPRPGLPRHHPCSRLHPMPRARCLRLPPPRRPAPTGAPGASCPTPLRCSLRGCWRVRRRRARAGSQGWVTGGWVRRNRAGRGVCSVRMRGARAESV